MSDMLEQQEAADHAMCHWRLRDTAPIKLGSDAHIVRDAVSIDALCDCDALRFLRK
jgi:hypothetical protein